MNSLPAFEFALAPRNPRLALGEVHLWRARLADVAPELRETLSQEESLRAARFHFARDRERFIAGRALRRLILGRYFGCDARTLLFAEGMSGKPALSGFPNDLRFNVSHSGDLFLLAVTSAGEIGVDVELVRDDVPFEILAEQYFAREDAQQIRTLGQPEKYWKFYEVWTSTEARLKALGLGLAGGTRVPAMERWTLHTFVPEPGYAAAFAVEGDRPEIRCWSWTN